MKTSHAVLSTIVLLYLVSEGTCGLFDSRKLDLESGDDELRLKDGLYDKIVNTLVSGYETASKIVHDLLEKHDDDGVLGSLYENLKKELSKLKEFVLGGKPSLAEEEVEAARQAVDRIIEEHKHIHETSRKILEGAIETVKNAKRAQRMVNEGPDMVRHRVYDIDRAIKEHVFDGPKKRVDVARNDVNYEDNLRSSVDFLQDQGIKLTDAEKEVLDGLLKRVRESLTRHAEEKKEVVTIE